MNQKTGKARKTQRRELAKYRQAIPLLGEAPVEHLQRIGIDVLAGERVLLARNDPRLNHRGALYQPVNSVCYDRGRGSPDARGGCSGSRSRAGARR